MENRCEKWLAGLLGDGCIHLCDDVRAAAKKEGFSRKELNDARENLGTKTFHQFDGAGQLPNWFWYMEVEK